jgi:tetratricopeptide (TPR) repeat protein
MISKWWQTTWDWHAPAIETKASKLSQRQFEIEFFEGIVRRQSDYWEVLSVLGNHYTAAKRYRDGLSVDERLASLRPNDAVVYYNLACSYSLVGSIQPSLDALEKALSLGYRDFLHMMRDKDLVAVRKDKRFKGLLSRYVKV